ncbi:unnamed protein product [Orchesella dallaii]|uniref:Uncharacterized protein n=1 Tax=Orchesella dallaii TaxID=48710 RepID=A0ABP1R359_9HEXA
MHPIIKLAFHTHNGIYKWWFRCKIRWNNNNSPICLRVESPSWKLLPWYFLTWIMLFGAVAGSIAFLLIREIFNPSPKISAIHIGILFYIGVCTSISWGVCLAFHEYWNEVVSAFNQFAIFEEDWRRGPAEAYRHPKTQYMRIWILSYEELTGMLTGSVDWGINKPGPNHYPIALILTFSMGMVMEKLLINILETEDLNQAYQKYKLVWLQYYMVKAPFNNVLAIGALIGFAGGTTMIWLSFNAWNYVTPFLAGIFPFLSVWMLIILLVVITSQVSIVEKSGRFIHKWKRESLLQPGIRQIKNIRHSKMLGRTLKCLPVACGPCCGINSNTPFSFLAILMKAVTDALLGIQL